MRGGGAVDYSNDRQQEGGAVKKYKSGFTEDQRKTIRESLTGFTREHALLLDLPPEAVVQEIRYWQQSNSDWPTNPKKTHREASFKLHNGICMVCRLQIESIAEATFHHLRRDIPNLHSPENMRPLHRWKGCHEQLHNALPGSLTAGSMTKKAIR
jgi:hypothetical protein